MHWKSNYSKNIKNGQIEFTVILMFFERLAFLMLCGRNAPNDLHLVQFNSTSYKNAKGSSIKKYGSPTTWMFTCK